MRKHNRSEFDVRTSNLSLDAHSAHMRQAANKALSTIMMVVLAGAHLQPQHQVGNLEGLPGPCVQQPATAQHQPHPHCMQQETHNCCSLTWTAGPTTSGSQSATFEYPPTMQAATLPCMPLEPPKHCCKASEHVQMFT
jgi:hypothetical protein